MYKSLQTGRAIAASIVVLFHLGGTMALEKYFGITSLSIPFSFGDAGVEFFFVLSGFIIYSAHRDDISKPNRLMNYIRKRLIRIYPTYWIIFISVFLLALAFSALRNTVPHDISQIIQSLLLLPQDKNLIGGTGAPVIIVAWTLQYEMIFYLFFALIILNRWAAIIIGISILLSYIAFTLPSSGSIPFPLSFLFNDYILLFAMGASVSAIHESKKTGKNTHQFYLLTGTLWFLLIAADKVVQLHLFNEWKTLLYGLASSMIIFGMVSAEDSGKIIGNKKWVQLLGDSSYVLYLIHFPLISILCKLFVSLHLNDFGIIGAAITYIVIFITCLISAALFHLYIERPIGNKLRKRRFNIS